jgi:hypothetical protein
MLKESYFPAVRVKIPLPGQTIPESKEGYAVVSVFSPEGVLNQRVSAACPYPGW